MPSLPSFPSCPGGPISKFQLFKLSAGEWAIQILYLAVPELRPVHLFRFGHLCHPGRPCRFRPAIPVDLELHLARLAHLFHPAHLFQTILFRNFCLNFNSSDGILIKMINYYLSGRELRLVHLCHLFLRLHLARLCHQFRLSLLSKFLK